MALLLYARRILRRERTFRDRQNPSDYMPDEDLLQKYRLPINNIIKLCNVVHVSLQHRTRRNHALQVSLQKNVIMLSEDSTIHWAKVMEYTNPPYPGVLRECQLQLSATKSSEILKLKFYYLYPLNYF